MKNLIIILSVFFVGYCIYAEYTTPEVYVTTNIYDGYVVDNYYCSELTQC